MSNLTQWKNKNRNQYYRKHVLCQKLLLENPIKRQIKEKLVKTPINHIRNKKSKVL